MTVEKFAGKADRLADRLQNLIDGGATISNVFPTTQNGIYIIIYTP